MPSDSNTSSGPAAADSGLPRPRLTSVFSDLWARRLGLIVAPAGSGKTTVLAQTVKLVDARVAWYGAEDVDKDPEAMLAHLKQAFDSAIGPTGAPWESVDDVVRVIELAAREPVLLVVDDLHALEGTPAEAVLERLLHHAPARLAVLAASRRAPDWNLSRRRVSGTVAEVTGDDLRFRSWEVERLFRDHYASPLAPEDLAAVTRLTEGWAAGLQLFHLATRDKSASERRRTLAFLNSGLPFLREYLIHNVLNELPGELAPFLVETSMLGRLRGTLCDELLGTTGSQAILEELERRGLVTFFLDDGPWYHCHEVLRAHLENTYLERVTEDEARSRYRWAASLLESAGALSDALRAYCRAEDWDAAGRLLGHKGEELSERGLPSGDWLPPALVNHDPWFLLTEARRHRAAGRWRAAVAAYHQAEAVMPAAAAAEICRRERATLASWLEPTPTPLPDWPGLLRTAVTQDPMAVHRRTKDSSDPHLLLVAGLAALAAGAPAAAAPVLARVTRQEGTSPVLVAVANMALAVAEVLEGGDGSGVEQAAEQLESLGLMGLTRFTSALARLGSAPGGVAEAAEVREACRSTEDPWGESVAALLQGWAGLSERDPRKLAGAAEPLAAAVAGFTGLGAYALVALAQSASALVSSRCGDPAAKAAASRAEAASRTVGSPGAQAVATLALAESGAGTAPDLREEAERLIASCGLAVPSNNRLAPAAVAASHRSPPVTVRCFRRFEMAVDGKPLDLTGLKPKARKVLRILALHAPDWLHREVLTEAVWPGVDGATGNRNLQVVISSLRRALQPGSGRGGSLMIAREDAAYRLALPPGAWVDHVEFDAALRTARMAQSRGEITAVRAVLHQALDLVPGPLLPEDGPDELVLCKREHYRAEVCHAAHTLAEILIEDGDPEGAAVVCERGLAVDRYSDSLWRLLVRSSEAAGDLAAAARARREYANVLADLGVDSASSL